MTNENIIKKLEKKNQELLFILGVSSTSLVIQCLNCQNYENNYN